MAVGRKPNRHRNADELVEEHEFILDLYHLLQDSYEEEWGRAKIRDTNDGGLLTGRTFVATISPLCLSPDSLMQVADVILPERRDVVSGLLPAYDGWHYHPSWDAPIPVVLDMGAAFAQFDNAEAVCAVL